MILRNTTYGNVAAKPAVSAPRTRRKGRREFKVNPSYINKTLTQCRKEEKRERRNRNLDGDAETERKWSRELELCEERFSHKSTF